MPTLPAFCRSCDAVYPSPLRAERPGEENRFEVPLPCPRCGEEGRVPPALLRSTAAAVEHVRRAGRRSGEEGAAHPADLLADLRSRVAGSLSRLELARRLGEEAPGLADALPGEVGPDDEVRPYLRLWAEAAALLREADGGEEGPGRSPADGEGGGGEAGIAARAVERLLERVGEAAAPDEVSKETARARSRLRSAGRNDPCPCGSGEKYKECHWRADLETTRG